MFPLLNKVRGSPDLEEVLQANQVAVKEVHESGVVNSYASQQAVPARMRARKAEQVYHRRMTMGEADADQAALWDDIAMLWMAMDVDSPTGAMADIYDRFDMTLRDCEQAFEPLENQVSALFAINGALSSWTYSTTQGRSIFSSQSCCPASLWTL